MTLPVIDNFTYNRATSGALSLTEPTGVVSGDGLVIIASAEVTNPGGDIFTTLPTGFTKIAEAGDNNSDVNTAAWYRVSDGAESSPISITHGGNGDSGGWYIRITGVNATMLQVVGAVLEGGNSATAIIPSLTTTAADALVIYACGSDGADTANSTQTVAPDPPWTLQDTKRSPNASTNSGVGQSWGYRDMASIGASGTATVTLTSPFTDGRAAFQFAISAAADSSIVPQIMHQRRMQQ